MLVLTPSAVRTSVARAAAPALFVPRRTAPAFTRRIASPSLTTLPRRAPLSTTTARFASPPRRFTAEHEWVTLEDGAAPTDAKVGTVGITAYASNNLGDVVFVELPSEGTKVTQGDQIGAVESVKAASDIYSPVTGTILAVNTKLGDEPSLLNKSPEANGWLCKIQLSDAAQFETLLDAEAYKTLCDEE